MSDHKNLLEEHDSYVENIWRAHAADIGEVAITWNKFHDTLSKLFAVIATPDSHSLGFAAWNAVPNDRYQRAMLISVVRCAYPTQNEAAERLITVLSNLNKAESLRNNTVHSPYTLSIVGNEFKIHPDDAAGNRLAESLVGKDLQKECKEFVECFEALNHFARRLMVHLRRDRWADRTQPLPSIPPMLGDADKRARKEIQEAHSRAKLERRRKQPRK